MTENIDLDDGQNDALLRRVNIVNKKVILKLKTDRQTNSLTPYTGMCRFFDLS